MIKVLNLYLGIGGNRKLWEDVEVTAVENNPEIAKIYHKFLPPNTIIEIEHEFCDHRKIQKVVFYTRRKIYSPNGDLVELYGRIIK